MRAPPREAARGATVVVVVIGVVVVVDQRPNVGALASPAAQPLAGRIPEQNQPHHPG